MTFLLLQLARLAFAGSVLIGGYELFVGWLEKDTKKKRIGILMIVIPIALLAVILAVGFLTAK